ncbi:MAG: hypothetical protein IPP97_10550 [Candidatus Obscuribacter sp.]|jgi:hypothetical protein|nr:hypothetical protein [Candidatus Obscuribacter sp.]MDQ5966082.1 hypothetical protein [Cyanobacteriota bacterium erpe_2018_sw_39hr_WHONDRS-SW48-000098_B_bin.30]MBK7839841.1 hypothetical protein [Candidatus Obscuribacter sp.]MBK9202086.1 hypothetical protein [Candidatus Obscuribacter sp.]MBK9620485.1 hypothetical protein [Candidatus Obscuribacter sp.]
MEPKCIKAAEFDLMTKLSLTIPTGKVRVRTGKCKEAAALIVELSSLDYQILVPDEFDGYTVAVELVGKIEPYRKSDFMCGGPGD